MREAAERKAYEMCLHLNVWTEKGKRITPDQLLGRKTHKPETIADVKAYAERAQAEYQASLEGLE